MCGIAGIISKGEPLDFTRIQTMIHAIRHRGPDDVGFYTAPLAHLGMARLSIIDLVSPGLCPLVYNNDKEEDKIVLVYNGEIYNYIELREELCGKGYIFQTASDSEVLLQAYREWGENCLDKLNGMFSFAILDCHRDLLFAARDRAGEKPFYYYQDESQFIFASEIKAILTQINIPVANIPEEFQALEYMSQENTLFTGVKCLLPGHKLLYRGIVKGYKGWRCSEYWNVLDHLWDIDPEKAVDELDALLYSSVQLRLRSDVPLGLYLSGGLDSSIIAYMAKPKICFSCNFPYGPKYDELEFASVVAKDIGAEHIIIRPTKEEFERYLPNIIYHLDMPVGSFSCFPLYMLAKKAKERVKIVLSGEGSDELFGGYTRYLTLVHDQQLYKISALRNYKSLLDYYYGSPLERFSRLLNRGAVSDEAIKSIIAKYFEQYDDIIHAMGYTEFKLMLVTLLQMEDRTSAAFGIENRSPFLDHRIIEFAFSISGGAKIKDMQTKFIVREVARRYLPKSLLERKDKMGLVAPITRWLHATGKRGEFDRSVYNKLCLDTWLEVFFGEKRYANID